MQALLARLSPDDFAGPTIFRIEPATSPHYREIESCRLCGNADLQPILSLGEQTLTGIFPRGLHPAPANGPLELVACTDAGGHDACGLVQLCQSYHPAELFGEDYGYRSAEEAAVRARLRECVEQLRARVPLSVGDLVLDLGSNDGTLLSFYPAKNLTIVGVDPAGEMLAGDYRPDIRLLPEFFSAELFRRQFGQRKAKIVTAMSLLASIEDPLTFLQDVASILDQEGVFHFEMNYLPSLVRSTNYHAICHEKLSYFSLRQIKWMTDRSGLKILAIDFNPIHGGSFAVTVAPQDSTMLENAEQLAAILEAEATVGLTNLEQQQEFRTAVEQNEIELPWLLHTLTSEGHRVLGCGSSTSANVLLQHCQITREILPAIIETDPRKIGCVTPGTNIPLVSAEEGRALGPDYILVLSGTAREEILQREAEFLARGGKLIFPLPAVEIVG